MSFVFKDLPYDYDALEPHIDARTMELHYSKHHKGYFDKFTRAIEGSGLEKLDLNEIFSDISAQSAGIRNNGGGYYNHTLFWSIMSPNGGGEPGGQLLKAIEAEFETFSKFADEFSNAAATRFGSGWAWLMVDGSKKLKVTSTPNQDNPLMDVAETKGTPILGLDVWEHAYYLKYQNRRPDYIAAWWNLVNWNEVTKNFEKALEG